MAVGKQTTALMVLSFSFVYPINAFAHTFFGDTQPLLNGAVHPFFTIPHMLLLLSLWLFFLCWDFEKRFLFSFVGGLGLGFLWPEAFSDFFRDVLFAGLLLLWSTKVVLRPPVRSSVVYFVVLVTGFIIAIDTVSGSHDWIENFVFQLAATFTLMAFFSYGLMLKRFLKTEWGVIAIRSLGAWLFAVALMMLAFLLA